MAKQGNLFGDQFPEREQPQASALRISKTQAGPAGASQRNFNRLLARIEKLQNQIQDRCAKLDSDLAFYARELHPKYASVNKCRREIIRLLRPYWAGETKPALGKRQRANLGAFMWELLDTIQPEDGSVLEDDLRSLQETLRPEMESQPEEAWVNEEREALEKMLAEAGLDVDLSDFKAGMEPADLVRKIAELNGRVDNLPAEEGTQASGASATHSPGKKTKMTREEKERQAAELRDLSVAKTYKQLVRVLHPDLETDPALRQRKETLMKALTVAYKEGDLYTMLKIEIDWLQQDGVDAQKLDGDKLKLYNQILKEQCEDLEEELRSVVWLPRYFPLRRYIISPFFQRLDRIAELYKAEATVESVEEILEDLKGPIARDTVRALIDEHQRMEKNRRAWGGF